MQTNLKFQGYWLEANKDSIPAQSGIYLVYRCTYNGRNVTLKEIIYIGESENVRQRITEHDKFHDWEKKLKVGEKICFSFAPVSGDSRVLGEAALIYKQQPPVNSEYKDNFPFGQTTVVSIGACNHLENPITAP